MLFHVFPYRWRNRVSLAPARLMQWTGLDRLIERLGLTKLLPRRLRDMKAMLPDLKPHYGQLPEVLEPEGKPRAQVALFLGCVADSLYPETNLNTARVLQANGCEVWIPRSQGCCGALHYHAAEEPTAREFAKANCDVFGATDAERFKSVDAIITNAAGCGAQLKDYAHMMHDTPQADAAARFQCKGPRRSRVPDGARPGETDAPALRSRRPITTPATCGTRSRSSGNRARYSK